MTVSTQTASVAAGADDRPLAVGLGGTLRANSSTEGAMRYRMTDPTVRHQLDHLSSDVLTLARATADPA